LARSQARKRAHLSITQSRSRLLAKFASSQVHAKLYFWSRDGSSAVAVAIEGRGR
jgi:hypothetical protein